MRPTSPPGEAAAGAARPPAAARAVRRVDDERFAEDLSLMLGAGLSLMDGLRTLREREAPGAQQPLAQLLRRLGQGETLSQAMQAGAAFNPALVACVRASEATGDMAASLRRYAANAARLRQLRSRMASALVYPALLVAVAACVVMFLLLVVVPRFALVLESSGQALPASSLALIAVGRALHAVPREALLALAAAAALGAVMLARRLRGQRLEELLSGLGARTPGVRRLVRAFGRGRFARSAAMLVRSGVPALKALAMCRALLAGDDRAALDRAVASASTGAPLGAALHAQGLVDALGLRVLRVAEQTGALDAALERLAELDERALERTLEQLGRLVEPLLMLGIGLVVGGIVVLMYLPIFQLAASI